METKKNIELLAPAGDLEKLRIVYEYGADAAYMGVGDFSLRAKTSEIDIDGLRYAVDLKEKLKKKLFVTLNILAHNRHLDEIFKIAKTCYDLGVDALIVADLGVISFLKQEFKDIDIHVSTQANTTNYLTVNFLESLGVSRVNLARELNLEEIKEIRERTNIELEVFIHGAMCIAYSGRCLISRYLTQRSGNLGGCAHSCRFKYKIISIKDEGRNKELDIQEHDEYTEILASEELLTLPILDKIIETGVDSLKIEGRTKSLAYLTHVVSIYRKAIDKILAGDKNFYTEEDLNILNELSPRGTWQGFYNSIANENYLKKDGKLVVGYVREVFNEGRKLLVDVKMPFNLDTPIYGFNPNKGNFLIDISKLVDIKGESRNKANPNDIVWIYTNQRVSKGTILKKDIVWKEEK